MVYILVSYDISDDRRRQRLARSLLRIGYSRLQRSLYMTVYKGYRGLARRAEEAARRSISSERDSVIIMTLPDWSVEKAIVLGPPVLRVGRRIVV